MTSREIILENVQHGHPERPGLNFGLKCPGEPDRINDIDGQSMGPSRIYTQKRWREGEMEFYDDEWGNVWYRMIHGSTSGEIHQPALRDWSQLKTLRLPDYDHPDRYHELRKWFYRPTGKFKMAFMPGWVFAASRYLRKMETYFVDLIEYREEINRLHTMVTDLLVRVIRRYAECAAEGIFFCEDLGTQDRPLIGPAMWRDIFRPHYLRLTGIAHECGLKVFMHSCGYNWDLIDSLIDAGIDCFQFDQPAAYDMPALAAKFKQRKVALWSPIDIQKVLPTGNRHRIESEAARMVDLFRGFLIVKNYPDLPSIGVQPKWDQWGYFAVLRASGLTPPQLEESKRGPALTGASQ